MEFKLEAQVHWRGGHEWDISCCCRLEGEPTWKGCGNQLVIDFSGCEWDVGCGVVVFGRGVSQSGQWANQRPSALYARLPNPHPTQNQPKAIAAKTSHLAEPSGDDISDPSQNATLLEDAHIGREQQFGYPSSLPDRKHGGGTKGCIVQDGAG